MALFASPDSALAGVLVRERGYLEYSPRAWLPSGAFPGVRRTVTYVNPLARAPIGPDKTRVEERHALTHAPDGGLYLHVWSQGKDIPYAEYFTVVARWHFSARLRLDASDPQAHREALQQRLHGDRDADLDISKADAQMMESAEDGSADSAGVLSALDRAAAATGDGRERPRSATRERKEAADDGLDGFLTPPPGRQQRRPSDENGDTNQGDKHENSLGAETYDTTVRLEAGVHWLKGTMWKSKISTAAINAARNGLMQVRDAILFTLRSEQHGKLCRIPVHALPDTLLRDASLRSFLFQASSVLRSASLEGTLMGQKGVATAAGRGRDRQGGPGGMRQYLHSPSTNSISSSMSFGDDQWTYDDADTASVSSLATDVPAPDDIDEESDFFAQRQQRADGTEERKQSAPDTQGPEQLQQQQRQQQQEAIQEEGGATEADVAAEIAASAFGGRRESRDSLGRSFSIPGNRRSSSFGSPGSSTRTGTDGAADAGNESMDDIVTVTVVEEYECVFYGKNVSDCLQVAYRDDKYVVIRSDFHRAEMDNNHRDSAAASAAVTTAAPQARHTHIPRIRGSPTAADAATQPTGRPNPFDTTRVAALANNEPATPQTPSAPPAPPPAPSDAAAEHKEDVPGGPAPVSSSSSSSSSTDNDDDDDDEVTDANLQDGTASDNGRNSDAAIEKANPDDADGPVNTTTQQQHDADAAPHSVSVKLLLHVCDMRTAASLPTPSAIATATTEAAPADAVLTKVAMTAAADATAAERQPAALPAPGLMMKSSSDSASVSEVVRTWRCTLPNTSHAANDFETFMGALRARLGVDKKEDAIAGRIGREASATATSSTEQANNTGSSSSTCTTSVPDERSSEAAEQQPRPGVVLYFQDPDAPVQVCLDEYAWEDFLIVCLQHVSAASHAPVDVRVTITPPAKRGIVGEPTLRDSGAEPRTKQRSRSGDSRAGFFTLGGGRHQQGSRASDDMDSIGPRRPTRAWRLNPFRAQARTLGPPVAGHASRSKHSTSVLRSFLQHTHHQHHESDGVGNSDTAAGVDSATPTASNVDRQDEAAAPAGTPVVAAKTPNDQENEDSAGVDDDPFLDDIEEEGEDGEDGDHDGENDIAPGPIADDREGGVGEGEDGEEEDSVDPEVEANEFDRSIRERGGPPVGAYLVAINGVRTNSLQARQLRTLLGQPARPLILEFRELVRKQVTRADAVAQKGCLDVSPGGAAGKRRQQQQQQAAAGEGAKLTYSMFLSKYNCEACKGLRKTVNRVINEYNKCDWKHAIKTGGSLPYETLLALYDHIESKMDAKGVLSNATPQGAGMPDMDDDEWVQLRIHIEDMIIPRVVDHTMECSPESPAADAQLFERIAALRSFVTLYHLGLRIKRPKEEREQQAAEAAEANMTQETEGESAPQRAGDDCENGDHGTGNSDDENPFGDDAAGSAAGGGRGGERERDSAPSVAKAMQSQALSTEMSDDKYVTEFVLGEEWLLAEREMCHAFEDISALAEYAHVKNGEKRAVSSRAGAGAGRRGFTTASRTSTPTSVMKQLRNVVRLVALAVEALSSTAVHDARRGGLTTSATASTRGEGTLVRWRKKSGKGSAAGCDDLLPALTYVVMRANPPRLATWMWFLEYFHNPSLHLGEESYCLAQVSSAVTFLRMVEPDGLDMDGQQFYAAVSRFHETQTAIEAAAAGDFKGVRRAVQHGADINSYSLSASDTALSAAVRARCYRALEYMLELGTEEETARASDTSAHNMTDARLVRIYRAANVNVRLDPVRGEAVTPLMLAATFGDTRSVLALLKHGADRYATDAYGDTALDLAQQGGHREAACILQADPARTTLIEECKNGNRDLVNGLLLQGCSPNAMDESRLCTPLIAAAYMGHIAVVQALIAYRHPALAAAEAAKHSAASPAASPAARSAGALPANAAPAGDADAAFWASVERTHRDLDEAGIGDSARKRAQQRQQRAHDVFSLTSSPGGRGDGAGTGPGMAEEDDVQLGLIHASVPLEMQRVDVNKRNILGETALMYCVQQPQVGQNDAQVIVAASLLRHGADRTLTDHRGDTAADWALRWGTKELQALLQTDPAREKIYEAARDRRFSTVQALLRQGADPNVVCEKKGYSALIAAAFNGDLRMMRIITAHKGLQINKPGRTGMTALHYAAQSGNEDIAAWLLRMGADRTCVNGKGQTPMAIAKAKNHRGVGLLLHHDPRRSSICVACARGQWEIARALIRQGVSVNSRQRHHSKKGWHHELYTPLIAACAHGHTDVVKMLLSVRGVLVDESNLLGQTPLMYASAKGFEHIVLMLLRAGAQRHLMDQRGTTAIDWARKYNHGDIQHILRSDPRSLRVHNAIAKGDRDAVIALFKQGVDVNERIIPQQPVMKRVMGSGGGGALGGSSAVGTGGLLMATAYPADPDGLGSEVRPLPVSASTPVAVPYGGGGGDHVGDGDSQGEEGAAVAAPIAPVSSAAPVVAEGGVRSRSAEFVTQRDVSAETPLIASVVHGQLAILRLILRAPHLLVDLSDRDGRTALMHAAIVGDDDAVQELLRRGAQRHAVDAHHKTALDYAVSGGRMEVAALLRADPAQVSIHDVAREGRILLMQALLKQGVHVETPDRRRGRVGNTPLIQAVLSRKINAVKFLLQHGAHADHCNDRGETPLMHALGVGALDIAAELLAHGADPERRDTAGQSCNTWAQKAGAMTVLKFKTRVFM